MQPKKPNHPKMLNHFKRFYHYKKQYNYSPKKILDIGALDGRWTVCLSQIYENANFLMIEANKDMEKILEKIGHKFIISVLSDDLKDANYYKLPGNAGNGLYFEKNSVNPEIQIVKTSTLNTLLDKNNTYNIIKLDVQGSELDILRGGMGFLERADFVLSECSLIEYNLGGPFFQDQLAFFESNNYKFVDIIDLLYDKKGQLIQIDVLFQNNKFNLNANNKS